MNQHIHDIANELAREGKKPSTALIKSRLKQPTSMRDIIETLKVWKFDPNSKPQVQPTTSPEANITDDIAVAIAPLQLEINQLKQEIQMLKTELSSIKQTLLTK